MRLQKTPVVAAALALLLACAPETKQPVEVMALVRTGTGGTYQPTQVQLRTVSDAVTLEGSVVKLLGGARVVVDPGKPLMQLNGGNLTEEQLENAIVEDPGSPPRASYVEKEGVLWPADFHTWNLVTTAFNLERAFDYFQAMGIPAATLGQLRVFYFPAFVDVAFSRQELRDNVFYFSTVKSLLLLPFDQLQQAPLAMNSGIMAHEYSHLVWNKLVYGGAAMPEVFTRWGTSIGTATPQVNVIKSVDEGLADYHAFVSTCRGAFGCDTRYLESTFDQAFTDARDIALKDKCVTAGLQNALDTMGVNQFVAGRNEYQVGTALASSLYHAGTSPNDWEVLSKSVLAAYSDTATPGIAQLITNNFNTPENFTLAAVLNTILAHTSSDELRVKLCGQFMGRMRVSRDSLSPSCPPQSQPVPDCAGK